MKPLKIFLLCCLTVFVQTKIVFNFTEEFNKKHFQNIKTKTKERENFFDFKLKDEIIFNCPKIPPSSPVPENASKLRFSDIKVQMALGDSITAGFSMVR